MKKILAFALTATFSLSLFAADIFSYVPVTGNVKNYTETDFSIATRFGTLYRTPSTKILHTFDANGKETSSSELTPKDAIINTISSTYDSAGHLTEQLCTSADGEVVWKNTYTYKNGLKVDASEYDRKGNLRARTIYTYENNLLTDESSYDGEGALIWKTIYKYADNKRVSSVNEYNGSLNEINTYNSDKQVIKRTLLKYDAKGNVNKVSEYDVAEKFGTTVNELVAMSEYTFEYTGSNSAASAK